MALFKKTGTIELAVQGMSCGHCEMRVKKALSGVPGVEEVKVSHERGQAVITVDARQPPALEALIAAVESAGYQAQQP